MDGLTWATVALAAATFLLVFWTILGDGIVRSYRQPKLHLEVEMKHPDCIKIKAVKHDQNRKEVAFCDAYYVRFRIFNRGKDPAINIDAFLESVEREHRW